LGVGMEDGTPHGKLILLVEDDCEVREGVSDLLIELGHGVVGAGNGEDALRRLREEGLRPNLILLDLRMDGMDGNQFREEQLRDPSLAAIPVVVVTADERLPSTAGLKGLPRLVKPVRMDDLAAAVAAHSDPRSAS
jgi:CheY-like chemotaxis protein